MRSLRVLTIAGSMFAAAACGGEKAEPKSEPKAEPQATISPAAPVDTLKPTTAPKAAKADTATGTAIERLRDSAVSGARGAVDANGKTVPMKKRP